MSSIPGDDLAEAYILAAERAPSVGGLVFDVQMISLRGVDFLNKLVIVSGAKGDVKVNQQTSSVGLSLVSKCLTLAPLLASIRKALAHTTLIRHYLARALLAWHSHKAG